MTKEQLRKQQLAAVKRVEVLEKAITTALKKHGATLQQGGYMDAIGTKDACVCAIGAALLSKAKDKDAAELLEFKYNKVSNDDGDIHAWAAKIVNDGISVKDLMQLECGFENWGVSERDGKTAADIHSPFWDLGVKLARKAYAKDKISLQDVERYVIRMKTAAYKKELLKEAGLKDDDCDDEC